MSKLDEARKEINSIDEQMAKLYEKRMNASKMIAEFKKKMAYLLLMEKEKMK